MEPRPVPIKNLIDQIVPEECKGRYCILKQICSSLFGSNPRELYQLKCVEILKWELNVDKDYEIDISEVWTVWIGDGYASAFADIYNEFGTDLTAHDMYNKVKDKVN